MKTKAQMLASTQWEAACERLRNALTPPVDMPDELPLDVEAALEIAQEALQAIRAAYFAPPPAQQINSEQA